MKPCRWLLIGALLLGGVAHAANPPTAIAANPAQWPADPAPDWEDEPPRLLALLQEGHKAVQALDLRTAAARFCSAARHGSVEAQYRLARTLLLQRGDPSAQLQGRSMLLLAAQNGHTRANQILEATGWVVLEEQWPLCLQKQHDPVLAQLPHQPPATEPVS
jgi:TPR repeat protein